MNNRNIQFWVIPPESDAEFAACMKDVFDIDAKPYDSSVSLLCIAEQPVQIAKDVKAPIPATKDHPRRVDYEYERAGVADIFIYAEPLAGFREAIVREFKTMAGWAITMASLLEGRYADCEKVIVVCDHLNTHTKGAFYEVFEPERARNLTRRVEFHYTPKHGSRLNITENELSSMTRQCVSGRRIGSVEELASETSAWSTDVTEAQRGADWQIKIGEARIKLKSVCPKIML